MTSRDISNAVKRVIAAAAGKQPSEILHETKLSDLGFSLQEQQALAAPLNQEFNRMGHPPDPELHPRHIEIARNVGHIVAMYRFIFEV